ncbi:MAG: SoxR reducing system RseC family protein, partial [Bacteroidales bacterium]
YCSMTDLEDKVVEVGTGEESLFVPGQAVTVSLEESLGYKALLFGYLLPFVVLLASIFLMIWITGSESLSAIAGLVLMFFYYYWLYRSREKLRRTFRFRVRA